jgi:hypothetical protein
MEKKGIPNTTKGYHSVCENQENGKHICYHTDPERSVPTSHMEDLNPILLYLPHEHNGNNSDQSQGTKAQGTVHPYLVSKHHHYHSSYYRKDNR